VTVIPLPEGVSFEDAEIGLERADQVMRSGYTGRRQTISWPFALWVFTARTVPEEGIAAGRLRSFLARLKGRVNTFRMPVPGAYSLAGYTGAVGLVNGTALAGSTTLPTDGWTPSTAIFKDGDYMTINDECKLVTADITSNGLGQALLPIDPPLKRTAPDNYQLVMGKDAYILLAAATSDMAKWKLSRPVRHTFNFVAVEAFE